MSSPLDPLPSGAPPTVLIANDQEWSARTLDSILAPAGYAVLRASSGQQALQLARAAQPDLLILDERMPDLLGTDVCRLLRDDPRFDAATPIVLVTSDSPNREQTLAGYRAGAWEYVQEPLDAEALLLRVGTYVRAKRSADRLRDATLLDAATGLYNLRGLSVRAREVGAEAYRQRSAFACIALAPDVQRPLALADVDTTLDEVEALVGEVGRLVREESRGSDVVGWLGRSELAIIAPFTDREGAVRLLERMRRRVDGAELTVGHPARPVRLLGGYCAVSDFTASSVDAGELLVRAAAALRHARTSTEPHRPRAFDELPVRMGA